MSRLDLCAALGEHLALVFGSEVRRQEPEASQMHAAFTERLEIW